MHLNDRTVIVIADGVDYVVDNGQLDNLHSCHISKSQINWLAEQQHDITDDKIYINRTLCWLTSHG